MSLKQFGVDLENIAITGAGSSLRALLNVRYPDDFEYYLIAFELYDVTGNLLDSLIFPVNPSSLTEDKSIQTNVQKTINAVFSDTNTSFAPSTITLNGTFGRKVRLLLNKRKTSFVTGGTSQKDIKTGFGVLKLLEKIIAASLQEGRMLFFYNYALGNNYLVEPVGGIQFSMSEENNMFWNYSLTLQSLARAEDVFPGGQKAYKSSIKNLLSKEIISNAVNNLASATTSLIRESRFYSENIK